MKHAASILGVSIISAFFMYNMQVSARAPQSSPTTPSNKKIDDLKERLATKVAELRRLETRALHGVVKSTSITSIVVETNTKDIKIELTDDIKVIQYLKGKRTALAIDDVEKNDDVTVFGDYDSTLDLLKAKLIIIENATSTHITGKITARDEKAFTATIETGNGTTYTMDFEKTTKATLWSGGVNEKIGFSKLEVGATILVTGSFVPKKENRVSAKRLLLVDVDGSTSRAPTPLAGPSLAPDATQAPTRKITQSPSKRPTASPSPTSTQQ